MTLCAFVSVCVRVRACVRAHVCICAYVYTRVSGAGGGMDVHLTRALNPSPFYCCGFAYASFLACPYYLETWELK